MKTDDRFNPLSTSYLTQARVERKACGVLRDADARGVAPHSVPNHVAQPMGRNKEHLEDEFLVLLLGGGPESNPEEGSASSRTESSKNHSLHGTISKNNPLKDREIRNETPNEQSKEFDFLIPHVSFGELRLKGQYKQGQLCVDLYLPKVLGDQQNAALARMLSVQLGRLLNVDVRVNVEIEID